MPNGTIKTFSRGGSDVTGAVVASRMSRTSASCSCWVRTTTIWAVSSSSRSSYHISRWKITGSPRADRPVWTAENRAPSPKMWYAMRCSGEKMLFCRA